MLFFDRLQRGWRKQRGTNRLLAQVLGSGSSDLFEVGTVGLLDQPVQRTCGLFGDLIKSFEEIRLAGPDTEPWDLKITSVQHQQFSLIEIRHTDSNMA